jgi:hypothetical protein
MRDDSKNDPKPVEIHYREMTLARWWANLFREIKGATEPLFRPVDHNAQATPYRHLASTR